MSKKENHEIREESASSSRKTRKHNLFALFVCLFVAFAIWLYASSLESKNQEELGTNEMHLPRTAETVVTEAWI